MKGMKRCETGQPHEEVTGVTGVMDVEHACLSAPLFSCTCLCAVAGDAQGEVEAGDIHLGATQEALGWQVTHVNHDQSAWQSEHETL